MPYGGGTTTTKTEEPVSSQVAEPFLAGDSASLGFPFVLTPRRWPEMESWAEALVSTAAARHRSGFIFACHVERSGFSVPRASR